MWVPDMDDQNRQMTDFLNRPLDVDRNASGIAAAAYLVDLFRLNTGWNEDWFDWNDDFGMEFRVFDVMNR